MKGFAGTIALVVLAGVGCSTGAPPAQSSAADPVATEATPDPRHQPGATIAMYAPEQHELYDGHFVISGARVYMVGGLNDAPGWNHMGNDASTVHPVEGTVNIDVDEIANTGTFDATLRIPEGNFVLTLDRLHEFSPCQNGGVAAYLYEHGTDSGCGDANWPKAFVYVAGWGYGHATLNGMPLYQDYEMHFMVTEGMRNRQTLRVDYPSDEASEAGRANPAAQQIDFYIRSPQTNAQNTPGREVFTHFFAMETTWR